MEMMAFSIRDAKSETYNTPFFAKSIGEAERNFARVVNDDKTVVADYPEDFDLYHLGVFDDRSGIVVSLDTPHHVAKAVNLIRS